MSNGHCFDTDTVLIFVNQLIVPETAQAKAVTEEATARGVAQTRSLKFQEEWPWVRSALMDLVCEIDGARDLFLKLLVDLKPWMTAPEWVVCG